MRISAYPTQSSARSRHLRPCLSAGRMSEMVARGSGNAKDSDFWVPRMGSSKRPPEQAGQRGVVEGEPDLLGCGPVSGVRELGEDAGVGFQLGRIGGALVDEEVFEAGGAVRCGGLVVDDPKDVFAGSVGREARAEDAVDADG